MKKKNFKALRIKKISISKVGGVYEIAGGNYSPGTGAGSSPPYLA